MVLALFVPLIISSGGNSGSQAATLVIRALALGEVGLRDWWRVMRREIFAGLALGGSWEASASSASVSGQRSRISTARIGSSSRSPSPCHLWVWCCGGRWRIAAAIPSEATGVRPGGVLGPIRRDAGGRDGPGDLFLGRARCLARHAAVAATSETHRSPTRLSRRALTCTDRSRTSTRIECQRPSRLPGLV